MLKRKALIIPIALFLLAFLALPALAQQEQVDVYENQKLVKSVVFVVGTREYFVNGQIPGVKMDVAPFVLAGRTFVPVRFLSNALGVEDENIGWNEKARLVTLKQPGYPVVELVISSKQLKSNGKVTNMDVSPLVRSGRTFLPARWVAEALGYQVDWDPKLNLVICWPKGEPKPDISGIKDYLNEQIGEAGSIWLARAEEFTGEPINMSEFDWEGLDKGNNPTFVPDMTIKKIKPGDIPPNGILMGSRKYGGNAILGVTFAKDGIYIKQASADDDRTGLSQIFLVMKDNKVSYGISMPGFYQYPTNPFTVKFPFSAALSDDLTLPDPRLEDVKGFLLEGGDKQVLYVENPYYKGR
ncbi:copper amine oxidase N-terminal domain-containing protein [Desulfofundulus sp. TPOSR]|uniref:copper amine oxidase N-terminal domain-containing protein n=1 Tax=Desulfofundulus sp. TPOSR TaxID=2714340 RepID=UPI00140D1E33|nr:copper amine oxidase N-terminal domain-containing protein [Desulfofundulus sp. TPOSR]NHM28055.1 copper amine oxidase N-terminal domain-containing protein [Desulfofundulus sp. TPOSR]